MTTQIVESTTFRNNMADVLSEVEKKKSIMIVAKRGKPISAIVSLDLMEDLLSLSSGRYLKDIKEARKQYKEGAFLSHKQVFGDL
ncbi:MAG: type II toxin-antitoxin system prevent-host-death family antitoxin [Patescibacteria group bacterium]|nr:type II toxin-antitoxin system prevent-host-death family antitoxin [Patescibacteria group bacterium]